MKKNKGTKDRKVKQNSKKGAIHVTSVYSKLLKGLHRKSFIQVTDNRRKEGSSLPKTYPMWLIKWPEGSRYAGLGGHN